VLSGRFLSERDFVAGYLLPRFREAAGVLGVSDVVDFHIEPPVDGRPDLTVERAGRRLLVVEAKFRKRVGRVERDIEPRDPDVIEQAVRYAALGGFPYYATCNLKRLVLFQLRPGVRAYESEIASFEYGRRRDWAEALLKIVLGIVSPRAKPLDDTLVDTLHEAFNDLYPEFLASLRGKLRDRRFRERYVEWLESQGIEATEESGRLIAEQTTYLQINKLLFYQVIRTIYPEHLKPLRVAEDESVSEALSRFYADARAIDYAPVYESDLISEIPFTRRAEERIRTLLDTLNEFDFSKMESDFLGRIYEKLIPPQDRKRLGQFYTPRGIVDLIVELTINKPDAVVLDPGCGSGSFLVRAYHRLRELKGIPREVRGPLSERFHRELLEQIYGIDINQFPAHLSVINLAIQNPRARIERVNVLVKDFFDIRPGQATLVGFEGLTAEGKPTLVKLPPAFDVVVANPPYIRQELLGAKEKEKIKRLIEDEFKDRLFIGAPRKRVKGAIVLDKKSDIYIYFFVHGIRLLRDKGFLGFISSNKWLEVRYGRAFQRFLLDYTKIHYVIEFDRAVFPDAEVNTAVTVLERESDEAERKANVVKFVRVKRRMEREELLRLIRETEESYEDDNIRINLVRQSELTPGKWNIYLRAPPVYYKIVNHPAVKPLGEIAEVFFGLKTGYNPFFILSEKEVKEREIEEEYIKPILYSPKELKGLVVRKKDIHKYVLYVYKEKSALKSTKVLEYIKYGERWKVKVSRGAERKPRYIPELESVKRHKPFWYSVPKLREPHIFIAQFSDKQLIIVYNEANALGSDNFLYILCKSQNEAKVLAGYLNSSIGGLCGELHSRSYGGGVLKIQTYEAKQIPVLDPSKISPIECSRIEEAFDQLVKAVELRCRAEDELERVKFKGRKEIGLLEPEARRRLEEALENEKRAREQLDEVIYDILDLTKEERKQIKKGLEELQEIRRLRTKT